MIPAEVAGAARAAGRHLLGSPEQVALDLPGDRTGLHVARAIYLAYTRSGELHYIGKVDRLAGAAGARLAEHRRTSVRKRQAWRRLWIVPLAPDMSVTELATLERSLIRQHRPPGNIQHAAA